MSGNTIGQIFRISTFGESHGPAIGVVIDGCPANLELDIGFIQKQLDRRRPGQSEITSPRNEPDHLEVLSGIFEGKTLGTPITMMIRNRDAKPEDYKNLKDVYRPSHADYTWEAKYGLRDYRGGGRSSARETAGRVMAGAVAIQLLKKEAIEIRAYVSQVHDIALDEHYLFPTTEEIDTSPVRCPHPAKAIEMQARIEEARKSKDSVGGIISLVVRGCPPGLGEPVFDKLQADLAKAVMSIPAVKGIEFGSGFSMASKVGSEINDAFMMKDSTIKTASNHSGGIQGGISNGMDITLRTAFKPPATIGTKQHTIDRDGNKIILEATGRHDPCVLPRAVPIVESMAALVLADHLLRWNAIKLI